MHHSDAGSASTPRSATPNGSPRPAREPSIGSVGDSYDNAMAESMIGLFKTELIRRRGPWRGLDDRRDRHPGMGRLVQQPAPLRGHRQHPTRPKPKPTTTAQHEPSETLQMAEPSLH